ncbi:MAG: UDP-N-acetylglucosamine 2-epimerase (non-hydrolyzing) [Anaerolineae bacterium UTCFX2]|jgi:UDP-N-acetylglucosamine 2-epimerase (non-hydrolysing)|nr:UDP-N-acetylglucosamine 2-epimerase (non-hydrolyzing) [Anaerolineales bacterium]OQY87215.1 MAG: UDP-N-acetylglucosamine 2-epimerase (non-hydrolyzing) [Anaerolineae bacterium UTCFX2]
MKIMHIAGARPNFMKVAPVMQALADCGSPLEQVLVHTGQHYDFEMSQVFFEDLGMPTPDEYLQVGSGSHAEQTGKIMIAFEPVLLRRKPDWVVVVGDVNSTVACALVCAKLNVRVAHVEAGLRSGDREMPEEINRLLTDQLADLLFTPSQDGDANLLREGIAPEKIHFVGNVMIDSLVKMLPAAALRTVLSDLGLEKKSYILVTLHRPSNVDNPEVLARILSALSELALRQPVLFPVHPRTRLRMQEFGLEAPGVRFLDPLGYLDFLALTQAADIVMTDSGGIQEETTFLGVPCLTLRANTERPITLELGTNRLVPSEKQAILEAAAHTRQGEPGARQIPPLWDGRAAARIAEVLLRNP